MKLNEQNQYDDDDIPQIDMPEKQVSDGSNANIESLPESARPRENNSAAK